MNIDNLGEYGVPRELVEHLRARGLKKLTSVQSEALRSGLMSRKSLVIAAPTSSGKTTIAELSAVSAAQQGSRTVYLVTHKALAEEKYAHFKREYDSDREPWFPVSISTGDRSEGEWRSGVLVATYEKFLSLIATRAVSTFENLIVIADEIQTLSAPSRGADIETLCTILLHAKPAQFIGLTATAPNIRELADWLGCDAVQVTVRDVPLRQEIWSNGKVTHNMCGDSEAFDSGSTAQGSDAVSAARALAERSLGPVLVFCMTKSRAETLAKQYADESRGRQKVVELARQLDLFSEPTSLGQQLRAVSEKRVAFHTADLSFAERGVVEEALRGGELDVVFATPTLAAGVNLPIRHVIFDSFQRSWLSPPWISQSEYTNMAGRAGRLGYHDEGTCVLLAGNRTEYGVAHRFITETPERVYSVLMARSVRKPVLHLISCGVCTSNASLVAFFRSTLWYRQTSDSNLTLAQQLEAKLREAVEWLSAVGLVVRSAEALIATALGKAVSATGLLPSTAISVLSIARTIEARSFDKLTNALIHLACASDEFADDVGQRFLPNAARNQATPDAYRTVRSWPVFVDPDARRNQPQVDNAAYLLSLWIEGKSENELLKSNPAVRYGQLQGLAQDVGWIFKGVASILCAPCFNTDQKLVTEFSILAKRLDLGVQVDAIDVLEAASANRVPGFGRHRAMNLVANDAAHPNKLLSLTTEVLGRLVDGVDRAKSLIAAVSDMFAKPQEYWRNRHLEIAGEIHADTALVAAAYDVDGLEYEDVVLTLLVRMELRAEKYDDGKKQGVPDLVVHLASGDLFVECKSREQKRSSPISTEDAFAVLTKANDLGGKHCVTVGKPDFGSHAKKKATSSGSITLVSNRVLVHAYLAYFSGKVPPHRVEAWLCQPGVALDIDQ